MTLDGLQSLVQKAVKPYWQPMLPHTMRSYIGRPKINLVRYADDFIVHFFKDKTIETVIPTLNKGIYGERGLMLSEEKTGIAHISEGFRFPWLQHPAGTNRMENFLSKPSKECDEEFLRQSTHQNPE